MLERILKNLSLSLLTKSNEWIGLVYPCLLAVKTFGATSAVLWQWGTEMRKRTRAENSWTAKQKEPGSCQTSQATPNRELHSKATLSRVPCYSQLNSYHPLEGPKKILPSTARWCVITSNSLVAYLARYPDSKEQNKGLRFCKTYNGSKENYEISQGHQRKKKPSQIHSEKPVMHQVFWHTGSLLSKLIKVPVSYTFLSLTSSQVRYTSCSKDGNKLFFICSPFKFSSLKQSLLKKNQLQLINCSPISFPGS